MGVAKILRSGLREAKRSSDKQIELRHLTAEEVDELAGETVAFLRTRPGRPSSVMPGWTSVAASKAGVIPWWAEEAGLTTETQRRSLRVLRRQVYDLLDERGMIVKPASPGSSVDVAPVAESAEPEVAQAEPTEPAAEPAGAEPLEPAPTVAEAQPAESEPAEESVAAGAWLLRSDPRVWDLGGYVADGHDVVSVWAVEDNDRSALMDRGQRVFLWVDGDGTRVAPGIWGAGWVTGPCQWRSVADGYWVDPAGNSRVGLFADVSIQLLAKPVSRQEVVDDPRLAELEVLGDASASNPCSVTNAQADALLALVGFDPQVPD